MTKSEAKAIEQRCQDALRVLEIPHAEGAIPYDRMDKATTDATYAAVKLAADKVREVLDMAQAELGGR